MGWGWLQVSRVRWELYPSVKLLSECLHWTAKRTFWVHAGVEPRTPELEMSDTPSPKPQQLFVARPAVRRIRRGAAPTPKPRRELQAGGSRPSQ